MKKITLVLLMSLFYISGYSQLALEGFETTTGPDVLPSTNWTLGTGNWAVFDNGVGTGQRWGINTTNVCVGSQIAYMNREFIGQGNTSEDYLATPLVLVPTNGELHFKTRTFANNNQGTLFQIKVATAAAVQTNPAAYTQIQQWDETTLTAVYNVCEEKIVDLSAYAGQQIYVSFVQVFTQPTASLGGDRWLVDDVSINTRCLVPTGLTATGITFNGANLNWANPSGATSWEIEVVPTANTPTGVGVVYSGTLPYPVTGLLPNTTYKYYVRALCSTGYTSAWSAVSNNFTTTVAPPICGGNFIDSGGIAGNYANNANLTTTITPATGEVVTITFTAFNTQAGFDILNVYNGPTAASPLIASLSGTTIPSSITSSAADGTLTFVFTSNATTVAAGWQSNITCGPPPVCPKPILLTTSSITPTTATLGWTNVGSATAWQILVLACGSPAPTATSTDWIDAPTNPFNLTGLTSASCYNIYVRGVCSPTESSDWGGPAILNTPVAPPICGGNYVDSGGTTGVYQNNENQTTVINPTTAGDQVTVTFTAFATETCCDRMRIYDGPNATSPLLGTYQGNALPPAFTASSASGALTFVFTSDGSVTAAGWIANITCSPPPACPKPTVLTTTGLLSTSVSLGWTNNGPATSWQVLALPCTSPAPTDTTIGWAPANTNPFLITGLTPSTCYNLYVRGDCSSTSNGVSLWSSPISVTTQNAPPVCGGTFVDSGGSAGVYQNNENITTTICATNPTDVVTVTFTSFATETCCDRIRIYDGNSATAPLLGTYQGTAIPPTFTSSATNGCLTFVFTSDGSVTAAGWIANVTCAPAPNCPRPTVLTATSITSTSALLGWTEPTPAVQQWEVIVLPFGSPVPLPTATGTIVSINPALFTGLTPATQYTFYVRSICPTTGTSLWSIGANFTTLIINDECSGAIFVPVNSSAVCQQIVSGTLTGATGSTPGTTAPCVGTANDDVWFQFVATNPFLTVSIQNIVGSTTNLNYGVYSGACGTLTQLFCSPLNTTSAVVNSITVGQTYYIRVYSNSAVAQTVTFDVCITTPSSCISGQTVCSLTNYVNTVGVLPGLGTIGCLFSSPNPTFFTVQVQTTGPINFLLTQSSVVGGAPDLDVDYAAWGPFTSQAAACTAIGNPPTLAPGIGVPVTQQTGCSFSALPTENLNIANAIAGQYYIVLITNYSDDPGFINLTQTNAGQPGAGATNCCPDAYFSYVPSTFCLSPGATNPVPVIAASSVAGTFSLSPASPTGLVFANTATGEINLAASTAGNYVILNTVAPTVSCIEQKQRSYTVSLVAPAVATISYALPSYCKNISTPEPVIQTGVTGGTYAVSPNGGLSIDTITGAINPSLSAPGIYTITYSLPGSTVCTNSNPQATVEILATPNIVQPAPVFACDSYTLPAITVGNYYSQSQLGGATIPLDISIPITTTQTIYIYAINANGCYSEKLFTVTVNSVPTPITYTVTPTTCTPPSGTITVDPPTSTSIITPGNIFISEVTDAGVGSLSYIELYNATGATVNLANYRLRVYYNGSPTLQTTSDLLLSGTMPNNTLKVIAIGSATNLGSIVPNLVFANCNGVNNNDNIRLTTSAGVLVDNWGATDGSIYTPNGGGYVYRRNPDATLPSTTWNPSDWTTVVPEVYGGVGNYQLAVSSYQYSLDNGAFQTSPLFSSLAGGPHILIVKDIVTNCTSAPITINVDVTDPIIPITTFTYPTSVCQIATVNPVADTSITGFSSGGTFSEAITTTGLVFVSTSTGEIDLVNSTAGIHTVIYHVDANPSICQSAGDSNPVNIEIIAATAPITEFTYPTSVCQIAGVNPLANITNPSFSTGGAFSESTTTGLVFLNTTTGEIDLVNSTTGLHTIIYHIDANPTICQSGADSIPVNITINAATPANVLFDYTSPVCQIAQSTLSPNLDGGFVSGGTFTSSAPTQLLISASTGIIDVQNSQPGSYTVTYSIGQNTTTCKSPTTSLVIPIEIIGAAPANVAFGYNTPFCAGGLNPLPNPAPGTAGGNYSSTTGLNIDSDTGEIDLTTSTPGTYTVTYAINQSTTVALCQSGNSDTAVIVISNPVGVTVFGDCVGVNYTLVANPIDNSFDPNAVSYSWEDSSGNPVGGNTQSIIVTEQGEYTVTVVSNGCSGTAMFSADDIACVIQKGISVNSTPDGLNDCLDLQGFNVKNLSIFNRYGMKVYSQSAYTNQWCGQSDNGDELPDGTYYYVIDRDNGETKTGWVYINKEI